MINLKTAKARSIEIPPRLLAVAGEVTASPSSVTLLALRRLTASAIAGKPRCPIDCLAAVKTNALAVAPDDDPIAVMLNFVHPLRPDRRFLALDRLGRHDESDREMRLQHAQIDSCPLTAAQLRRGASVSRASAGRVWLGFDGQYARDADSGSMFDGAEPTKRQRRGVHAMQGMPWTRRHLGSKSGTATRISKPCGRRASGLR